MRLFFPIAFITLSPIGAFAQQSQPKPPVGVPADASLFNGKWYRLYLEEGTWDRARQRCATLGGRLVIVPDAPTWTFIKPMTQELNVWLGATDEKTEGLWIWLDGTRMTFKAWAAGQPDSRRGQNYLRTDRNGWDDIEKTAKAVGFICEWKAK